MVSVNVDNLKAFKLASIIASNAHNYGKYDIQYIKLSGSDIFATDGTVFLYCKDALNKKLENDVYLKFKHHNSLRLRNKSVDKVNINFLPDHKIAIINDNFGKYVADMSLDIVWYDQYHKFLQINEPYSLDYQPILGDKSSWIMREVGKIYKNTDVYWIGTKNSDLISLVNENDSNCIIISIGLRKNRLLLESASNAIMKNNEIRMKFSEKSS